MIIGFPIVILLITPNNFVLSTSTQYKLPHLVSPERDRNLALSYKTAIIGLKRQDLPEHLIHSIIERIPENRYNDIVNHHSAIYELDNELWKHPEWWRTQTKEIHPQVSKLTQLRSNLPKITGEYNWLQKRFRNRPDNQLRAEGEIIFSKNQKPYLRIPKVEPKDNEEYIYPHGKPVNDEE